MSHFYNLKNTVSPILHVTKNSKHESNFGLKLIYNNIAACNDEKGEQEKSTEPFTSTSESKLIFDKLVGYGKMRNGKKF